MQSFQSLLARARKQPGWTTSWEIYCRLVRHEVWEHTFDHYTMDQWRAAQAGRKSRRKRHLTFTYNDQGADGADARGVGDPTGGGKRKIVFMALPGEFIRLILIKSTYGGVENLGIVVEALERVGENAKLQLRATARRSVVLVNIPTWELGGRAYHVIPNVCKQWYMTHKAIFSKLGKVVLALD